VEAIKKQMALYWARTINAFNMLMIESSVSRHPEWEAYKARTGMLLPWRFCVSKPTEQPQVA
jgi:hypothetical protein